MWPEFDPGERGPFRDEPPESTVSNPQPTRDGIRRSVHAPILLRFSSFVPTAVRRDPFTSRRHRLAGLALGALLKFLEVGLKRLQSRGLGLLLGFVADELCDPVLERLELLFDPRFGVFGGSAEVVPCVLEVFTHTCPLAKDKYNPCGVVVRAGPLSTTANPRIHRRARWRPARA